MNSCEYCMSVEDLEDFSSGNLYVVSLGFVFNTMPRVEEVVVVPKSKLERYRRGEYGWQVIEEQKLPQPHTRQDINEIFIRICAKYGKVHLTSNQINMSHEERVKATNEIARKLILRPYVNSVHLTGSTSLSMDRIDSDIDLLVVLGYCPGNNGHHEMDKFGKGYRCPVDFFYIRERDFLRSHHLGYPLIRDGKLIASK